jgi:enoyl-CoA hydratase/carnithine racemase
MCAMHGHAYAGGFIFALCHDFRVMYEKSKLCLSEIGLGVTFCPAYNELCKNLMSRQILREMMMGRVINVQEALDRQILSASFDSDS